MKADKPPKNPINVYERARLGPLVRCDRYPGARVSDPTILICLQSPLAAARPVRGSARIAGGNIVGAVLGPGDGRVRRPPGDEQKHQNFVSHVPRQAPLRYTPGLREHELQPLRIVRETQRHSDVGLARERVEPNELLLVALFDDPEYVVSHFRSGVTARHGLRPAGTVAEVALTIEPGHEGFAVLLFPPELQAHGLQAGDQDRRDVRVLLGLDSPSTTLRDEAGPHHAVDHGELFGMKTRGQINDIVVSQGTPPELRLA